MKRQRTRVCSCHAFAMRLATILAISALAPAAAAPAPRVLKMRHVDGTTVHLAGDGGAIQWSAEVTVQVELAADGTVTATASGWRKEHNLYATPGGRSYNTDDTTQLTITWTGTWKTARGGLLLDLALGGETCTRTKTSDGAPPEALACRAASPAIKLACPTSSVTLGKTKVEVWNCAIQVGDLGESPSWLLGKTSCIQTSAGHMGRTTFSKC
jgi:hypothetical protein